MARFDNEKCMTCYEFDPRSSVDIVVKNNTILDLEENRIDDDLGGTGLSALELKILQTTFLMIQQVNIDNKSKNYNSETEFVISIQNFVDLWKLSSKDMSENSFVTLIRRAIARLDARRFQYKELSDDGNQTGATVLSGYFSSIKFSKSRSIDPDANVFELSKISFNFPKEIIKYFKHKHYGEFTWYFFENIVNLKNSPPSAIILFEQFSKYKHTNINRVSKEQIKLPIGLDKLRKILSVPKGYNNADMLRKIIKPSIEEINSKTSIRVLDTERVTDNTRTITDLVFVLDFTDPREFEYKAVIEEIKKNRKLMSIPQTKYFSKELAADNEFFEKNRKPDEQKNDFIKRISVELLEDENVLRYMDSLIRVGYVNKNLTSL
ncbi:hypothetical protein A7M79_01160 [Acinetobacter baumannii]|uniref:replication initiation protein n=1 Tax=Acinetobacter baumannii TaxID=470 RepID=UPI0008DDAC64|nr:replication initiation protein [Acinetobacter baumannii]OIH12126.1 hypothetical protein A7M79_01160 [Acinetobacter baumannii]